MINPLDLAADRVRCARPGPLKSAAVRRLIWELKLSLNPSARPEPRIRIIGLSGDPGSGKDTVGHMLATTAGYSPLAFADALRREVAGAWHCTDPLALTARGVKELRHPRWSLERCSHVPFVRWASRDGANTQLPRSPREVMQLWGGWRRSVDPDYWVKRADQYVRAAATGGQHHYVVTDVRFRNELEWVHAMGGEVWRIHRPEAEANRTSHQSCQELVEVPMDRIVHNDGTLEQLAADVERVLALHDAEVLA